VAIISASHTQLIASGGNALGSGRLRGSGFAVATAAILAFKCGRCIRGLFGVLTFHYLATYTGVATQRLGMVLPSCPGGRERGEDALCRSAERPVRNILELTGLGPQEEVLEIG